MGTLARFDLAALQNQYGLRYFVETGTGRGDSLAVAAALNPGFDALLSCEIEASLVTAAKARFLDDPRITIHPKASAVFLDRVCRLLPRDQPALFWLDAHFPGADYGLHGYGDEADDAVRLPLAEELRAITRHRPDGKDVVIVDDLRIYQDGPFQHGNLPAEVRAVCPKARGVTFVKSVMGDTHEMKLLYEHEGYILLTPNEGQQDGR